jgi:hypothetical protein
MMRGGYKKLHNERRAGAYLATNIVMVIKIRRATWMGKKQSWTEQKCVLNFDGENRRNGAVVKINFQKLRAHKMTIFY